jgi:hypothetical protein
MGWSFINLCDLRKVQFNGVTLEGSIFVDCKMYSQIPFVIDLGKKFPAKLINIDFTPEGDGSLIIQMEEFLARIEGNFHVNE